MLISPIFSVLFTGQYYHWMADISLDIGPKLELKKKIDLPYRSSPKIGIPSNIISIYWQIFKTLLTV